MLAVVRDQEDPGRRLLLILKSNYAKDQQEGALAFCPDTDEDGRPRLLWAPDRIAVDPELAMNGALDPGEKAAGDEVIEWLRTALAGGPQAAADLRKEARGEGIADRTLKRGAKRLGVIIERKGFPCRSTWQLPDAQLGQEPPVRPSPATRPNMAQLANVGPTGGDGEAAGSAPNYWDDHDEAGRDGGPGLF